MSHLYDYKTDSIAESLITKDSVTIIEPRYQNPQTSSLVFHFQPHHFAQLETKLKHSLIDYFAVENKECYVIDQFFSKEELTDLFDYSEKATFSRFSYASQESRLTGEEPAKSMNNQEKWQFFSCPPKSMKEVFHLLSLFADRLDADIMTLPWDLCDGSLCASAVATNRLEKVSEETMTKGQHQDYTTEKAISFEIPVLYESKESNHPSHFVNGEKGRPLFVTLMVYATAPNFSSGFGMGTVFYTKDGEIARISNCSHGRIVLFEGDLLHSIEKSSIPESCKSWRISYVFKLVINPKDPSQSLKEKLKYLLHSIK